MRDADRRLALYGQKQFLSFLEIDLERQEFFSSPGGENRHPG